MRMRTHHNRQCDVGENQGVRIAPTICALSVRFTLFVWLLTWGLLAHAGAQKPEVLADSVRTLLRQSILASAPMQRPFFSDEEFSTYQAWQMRSSARLLHYIPAAPTRQQLLAMVDYEAHRAGLEPALVMAVIEVESQFKPHAKSHASARGLMQVMPFWVKTIGDGQVKNLHDARINVRYGCVILRHYLDIENGDLVRALGRYNGSLGRLDYPKKVFAVLSHWR
ncbi:MAG: mltC 1 [Burkholderiaceae bacterium]|nr:mltC 1 [Burkholderiaceae bacterium]